VESLQSAHSVVMGEVALSAQHYVVPQTYVAIHDTHSGQHSGTNLAYTAGGNSVESETFACK